MSFSAFFYLVSVVGAYQLGAYNSSHPGALIQCGRDIWSWIIKQGNSHRRN